MLLAYCSSFSVPCSKLLIRHCFFDIVVAFAILYLTLLAQCSLFLLPLLLLLLVWHFLLACSLLMLLLFDVAPYLMILLLLLLLLMFFARRCYSCCSLFDVVTPLVVWCCCSSSCSLFDTIDPLVVPFVWSCCYFVRLFSMRFT